MIPPKTFHFPRTKKVLSSSRTGISGYILRMFYKRNRANHCDLFGLLSPERVSLMLHGLTIKSQKRKELQTFAFLSSMLGLLQFVPLYFSFQYMSLCFFMLQLTLFTHFSVKLSSTLACNSCGTGLQHKPLFQSAWHTYKCS